MYKLRANVVFIRYCLSIYTTKGCTAEFFCGGILFRCVLGCVREWGQTNWGNMVNYNKIHQHRNYLLGASDNKWITR